MFYLIRHGEPDYSERGTKIYKGYGENFAPLTSTGVSQIKAATHDSRLLGTNIIISSPYTRALQSAAILSKELSVDIAVETNLHEWVANKYYLFLEKDEREACCNEFNLYDGCYPDGKTMSWENNELLSERLLSILTKYSIYEKVIIVCHGMLIHSVCRDRWANHGEIFEFDL